MNSALQLGTGSNKRSRLPGYTHVLALTCAGIVAVLAFTLPASSVKGYIANNGKAFDNLVKVTLPLPESPARKGSGDAERWHTTSVKKGDNLSLIFSRLGMRADDLYLLMSAGNESKALARLLPGQLFKIRTDGRGDLLELVHAIDEIHGTRVVRQGDGFKVARYEREIEKRTGFAAGTIQNSLYQAAMDANLSDRMIMKLVEIFGWDIDFALDIQPGDTFIVLYEEDYFAGERLGGGDILAAEFINQGKVYRAVRYVDATGEVNYYTPEGGTMRQAFLRTPVDFRRISSHFQQARWHPSLGKRRPHRGVDYSAPTGTPVRASGDGTVEFVGWRNGYGKTVILKHWQRYTTLYAHMSRFAKGLRKGDRVRQGDVIAYVGRTGMATGSHLHYEFRVDGVHHDPLTVKLPGAVPIEQRYLADFKEKAVYWTNRLQLHRRLALNTDY